ncbi:uncharacterized protein LOC131246290 [Magnolia sinica]|uniref:uncharacterized protein LOC131246290 n=1 Tax=Magnolia sinica TaxID=86752 RepID=UPI002657E59A|nr:uncharacterized protein LOC131246290 [Magnolia sinica]
MAEPQIQIEEPLINPNHTQEEESNNPTLDRVIHRLEAFLFIFGFHQCSFLTIVLSWAAFLLLGVVIPVLTIELSSCSDCSKVQITNFELFILASQASLAAVSLLGVSHNLRKYGVRRFLFVDRFHGQTIRFRKEYVEKIEDFFHVLVWWILPCFLLKTAREIIRLVYVHQESWWQTVGIFLALVVSWTYLTTIFLSACSLFYLVCNLQCIHFEDYGKLLERDSDAPKLLEEHMLLRHHLSKISHRFRIYLLVAFLVVTASQFVTLFHTTGYRGIITFINGGDFAVSSIVEVVGIILCLHAAAKVSHRAQGIASVACRWHALVTCSSTDPSQLRATNSAGNLEADAPYTIPVNYSESDLESLDNVALPTNPQFASYMSSYHKRQALVMYLQSNPGGLSIFGWTVDRALISTIFFIELSLALFVLGKTIVFTSK